MTGISVWRGGERLAFANGEGEVSLLFGGAYADGDEIRFETDSEYAVVQVDQTVLPARIYLPSHGFTYRIPLAEDGLAPYAPGAFGGEQHLITIRTDTDGVYRNLARNPIDQRGDVQAYPHASANVETRGESVFAARNVIDGLCIADGHGIWPFGSWGIGEHVHPELTVDFGREVEIDTVVLYLRADFPHDACWQSARVTLDDGYAQTFPLEEKAGAQRIYIGKHRTRSIKLDDLVKRDAPGAFFSLRQIEVYGEEI